MFSFKCIQSLKWKSRIRKFCTLISFINKQHDVYFSNLLPFIFIHFIQARNTVLISEYLLIFSSTTIHSSYTISPTHTYMGAHAHTNTQMYTLASEIMLFKKGCFSCVDFYSICCLIADS